jgi:hypothetical protein
MLPGDFVVVNSHDLGDRSYQHTVFRVVATTAGPAPGAGNVVLQALNGWSADRPVMLNDTHWAFSRVSATFVEALVGTTASKEAASSRG